MLNQVAPGECDLAPLQTPDTKKRAQMVLANADIIGCKKFVTPEDLVNGNARLNIAFVATIFSKFPEMGLAGKAGDLMDENVALKDELDSLKRAQAENEALFSMYSVDLVPKLISFSVKEKELLQSESANLKQSHQQLQEAYQKLKENAGKLQQGFNNLKEQYTKVVDQAKQMSENNSKLQRDNITLQKTNEQLKEHMDRLQQVQLFVVDDC